MYKVAALLLLASSGYGLNDVSDKIMTKLHHFNLCSACWGEEYADEYIKNIYEASAKCYKSPSAMPMADSVLGFPATLISGKGKIYIIHNKVVISSKYGLKAFDISNQKYF